MAAAPHIDPIDLISDLLEGPRSVQARTKA